jgi:predicted membrane protein
MSFESPLKWDVKKFALFMLVLLIFGYLATVATGLLAIEHWFLVWMISGMFSYWALRRWNREVGITG